MEVSGEYFECLLNSFRESLAILFKDDEFGRIDMEETRLDTSGAKPMVVVLFRNLEHPECLFGWSMHAVETWEEHGEPMDPRIWNTVLWANLMEVVCTEQVRLGQCCSSGVTWVY